MLLKIRSLVLINVCYESTLKNEFIAKYLLIFYHLKYTDIFKIEQMEKNEIKVKNKVI